MSDITVETRAPINVTIAPSDMVLAAAVGEFAATLNFLVAQVSEAVQTVDGKVNRSELEAIESAIAAIQNQIVDWTAQLQLKANSSHNQPISSITGLDQQLAQIAQQLLAVQGAGDFSDDIATLQALIQTKADNTALTVLDTELTAAELNLQALSTALGGKANSSHSHALTAVSGLQSALDNLQTQITALSAQGSSSPSSGNLVYTVTQSSIANDNSNLQGTYARLTDGLFNTGCFTNDHASPNAWVRFDLGSVKTVDRIGVGGGNTEGVSNFAGLLNVSRLQISNNATDWIDVLNFSNMSNSALVWFAPMFRARYLQIVRGTPGQNVAVGVIEFRIEGF